MNKKEIQQRTLLNGKPLPLDQFSWGEKTRTFSNSCDGTVIDFSGLQGCTIDAGSNCTIKAGSNCTIKAGWGCTIDAWVDCTIKAGSNCTIDAGSNCTIKAGSNCTIKAGWGCTIDAGSSCTIKAGSNCTIDAWVDCTINAGPNCTIKAGWGCTIDAGVECVVVRKDVFEFFSPQPGRTIKINPPGIPSYLILDVDVWRDIDGNECIVADGILCHDTGGS